jgi:hypothetical protein
MHFDCETIDKCKQAHPIVHALCFLAIQVMLTHVLIDLALAALDKLCLGMKDMSKSFPTTKSVCDFHAMY